MSVGVRDGSRISAPGNGGDDKAKRRRE